MEPNELESLPAAPNVPLANLISRMQAEGGALTAVVSVTRADTGKVDEYTLVMAPAKEQE